MELINRTKTEVPPAVAEELAERCRAKAREIFGPNARYQLLSPETRTKIAIDVIWEEVVAVRTALFGVERD